MTYIALLLNHLTHPHRGHVYRKMACWYELLGTHCTTDTTDMFTAGALHLQQHIPTILPELSTEILLLPISANIQLLVL